jgi:hypothetical protein
MLDLLDSAVGFGDSKVFTDLDRVPVRLTGARRPKQYKLGNAHLTGFVFRIH